MLYTQYLQVPPRARRKDSSIADEYHDNGSCGMHHTIEAPRVMPSMVCPSTVSTPRPSTPYIIFIYHILWA
jgi:hypothetical protein